jgi:Zn-dependent peptidase ImmA (M78 family)
MLSFGGVYCPRQGLYQRIRSSMTIKGIHARVTEILATAENLKAPVNIIELARSRGVKVYPFPLGEVATCLFIEHGTAKLGFDSKLNRLRSRFAIAHAWGHFILHGFQEELFVDKMFRMKKQDFQTELHYKLEQEAHEFACAILMPEALLAAEVEKVTFDLADDEGLHALAKKFDVSYSALCYRLFSLKFI